MRNIRKTFFLATFTHATLNYWGQLFLLKYGKKYLRLHVVNQRNWSKVNLNRFGISKTSLKNTYFKLVYILSCHIKHNTSLYEFKFLPITPYQKRPKISLIVPYKFPMNSLLFIEKTVKRGYWLFASDILAFDAWSLPVKTLKNSQMLCLMWLSLHVHNSRIEVLFSITIC